jgi:hypothetical protein
MAIKEGDKKLEGIGGWLYFYFIFCALEGLFLYGFIGSTYNSLTSGTGGTRTIFFLITAVLQVILLVSSLDLILVKKKSAKIWSILSLLVCVILFITILVFSSGKALPENYIQYMLFFILGSLLLIFYFIQSERVKNTFVK